MLAEYRRLLSRQKAISIPGPRRPWRLDADGWWIRSEIVWHKPNPMPESCTDRPTSAHEKLYLLSKSARYFYDSEAVRVPTIAMGVHRRPAGGQMSHENKPSWANGAIPEQANLRNVWTIPTHSFREAHFATFPPRLVEPCIKAGTSERGVCKQCGGPWVREVDTPENTTHFRSGTDINKGKFITGGQKQHDEYVRPKTNRLEAHLPMQASNIRAGHRP